MPTPSPLPGIPAATETRWKFWQNLSGVKISERSSAYISPKTVTSPKPRLFALLIGINFYQYVRSLRCAQSDVLAVKDYLESYLAVPKDQIRTLLNKDATRSAIIQAFTSLAEDARIQSGDPIFIFYAGHGSLIPTPAGSPDSNIQVLVPQDYCEIPGQEISSIPDRTIGALLAKIAEKKGDNITVVFDCCHSASGTRGNDDVRIRSVEVELSVHEDLDRDILDEGSRSASITSGFIHSGLRSHVLIAACSASELSAESTESPGHGNFSSAFLKLLRSVSPNELRYRDILTHMDAIPSQNPQCEGVNQDRFLFDAKVSKPVRLCYGVRLEEGQVVLEAGAAHGIAKGAEFNVYKNKDSPSDEPLGNLSVACVRSFSAILIDPIGTMPDITQSAVAVQTRAGERDDLRLYIPLDDKLLPCYQAWVSLAQEGPESIQNIKLVGSPQDAHLELAMENGKVVFLFRDDRVTQCGFTRIYHGVEPDVEELGPIFKSAAHYYWKLDLTNNNPDVTSSIQMEFYKLDASEFNFDDETGMPEMTPIGSNLCKNNVVDFVVEEAAPYGVKLINNSPYDFYPHLFYFDNSDLSIGEYYQPSSSGRYTLDVPLKANGGVLTIGYGTGGSSPFSYFLRENQNVDVGFLKLFVSTKPIDLSIIPQASPFEKSRGSTNLSKKSDETWGTILVPVIQRRYPPTPETHCVQCGSMTAKSLDIQQTKMVRDLEAENHMLKGELEVLRENAATEKPRLEEEISSLHNRLAQLQQEHAETTKLLEFEKQRQNDLGTSTHRNETAGTSNRTSKQGDVRPNTPARRPTLSERVRKFLGL